MNRSKKRELTNLEKKISQVKRKKGVNKNLKQIEDAKKARVQNRINQNAERKTLRDEVKAHIGKQYNVSAGRVVLMGAIDYSKNLTENIKIGVKFTIKK